VATGEAADLHKLNYRLPAFMCRGTKLHWASSKADEGQTGSISPKVVPALHGESTVLV